MTQLKKIRQESVENLPRESSKILLPKIIDTAKIRTINEAVKSDLPTVNRMCREKGDQKTKALIIGMLMSVNAKIKFKDKLEENDMEGLAESILLKYGSLKISDLVYVFNQITDGEIDLYGSLSHRDVMKALKNHHDIRWQIK